MPSKPTPGKQGDTRAQFRGETVERRLLLSVVWITGTAGDDTLFGTAFRQGDVVILEDIADEIEGGVPWQLRSTLDDAADWIRQAPEDKREELGAVLDRLRGAHA